MTEPIGTAWSFERALADRAWIRRIARELAGDASLADDLAQDAWLVARDRAPRDSDAREAWLRGVMKRLARQSRREGARRDRRERAAATNEALPASDELVQRAELQRRVAEAVVALAEPYRGVVLLRYFEGLEAAEIARRRGVPAATVRSQLARGLARLREELDERQPGGREAWMGCFASWFGAPGGSAVSAPAGGAVSVLGGMLAMKGLVLALAAAAAAIGVWFALRALDTKSPAIESVARAEEALPPGSAAVESASNASSDAERRSVASAPEVEAPREPEKPVKAAIEGAASAPAVIEARLVDERGNAIAGGALEVEELRTRSTSDAGGRVRLELAVPFPERSVLAIASAPGHATTTVLTRLAQGARVPLGELVLRAAGSISGRVVDADGAPLAGVEIVATGPAPAVRDPEELRRQGPRGTDWTARFPGARSAADGSFRIEGVPAGPALAWAGGEPYAWSSSAPLEVRAGEELRGVEIRVDELERADRIQARVLSPSGDPVPHASIVLRFAFADSSTTTSMKADAEGRVDRLLDQRVAHDFEARDPEDRWSPVYAFGVEPGTSDLVLQFEEARWIEVRPRAGGERIEEARVSAQRFLDESYWQDTGQRASLDPSTGDARLRAPTIPFRFVVDAPGYALATLGPYEPSQAPDVIEVALEALPGVSGRVLADGAPVAGARVMLHELWAPTVMYVADGFRSLVREDPAGETTSDAEGRFHLDLREAGEYLLRAESPGRAPAERWELALDPREGASGIELAFVPGGAIEGRLVPADGASAEGRVVGIHHGDGRAQTRRVGADGAFRFEQLAPGMWQVMTCERELESFSRSTSLTTSDRAVEPTWSCEVFSGETTYYDLVEEREDCALEGRLALGDAALAGWTAELRPPPPPDGSPVERLGAPIAEDGRFRFVSPRSGTHALTLRAPGSERGGLVFELSLELRKGKNERAIELAAGTLSGEGAPKGNVETVLEYRWRSPDDPRLRCTARLVPSADGRFALPLAPAGEATIHAYAPLAHGTERGWREAARFTVPAGGSEHVVLP